MTTRSGYGWELGPVLHLIWRREPSPLLFLASYPASFEILRNLWMTSLPPLPQNEERRKRMTSSPFNIPIGFRPIRGEEWISLDQWETRPSSEEAGGKSPSHSFLGNFSLCEKYLGRERGRERVRREHLGKRGSRKRREREREKECCE